VRAIVVGPVAAWSVADVWRGWCRGLRDCGVTTMPFSMTDRFLYFQDAVMLDSAGEVTKQMEKQEAMTAATYGLLASAYDFQPDVVFIVHGANVDPSVVAKLRCPVVLVLTESPYEDDIQSVFAMTCEPAMILLNDPTHQAVFDQIAPSFYVPHAYDPDVHHPGPSDFKADCVFVATGFPNRVEWLERVDWTGIDLVLGGEWALLDESVLRRYVAHQDDLSKCVDNDTTADWYRGSKTGFNVYRYEMQGPNSKPEGWAIGPREVEMAACRLWFPRQSRGESDEVLPMLPSFDQPEELGDLIRWGIAHPDECDRAINEAFTAVEDRTFQSHAMRALARLSL
jgi:spore maturation protein CgeB